ncbi:MAG: hypothetical protein KAH05_07815 [Clostridiales bacterium]|nr:hypothetical protein [Clostridiales bacterium]
MTENQLQKFWEIIASFEKNELLEHLMIIGSWAEVIYQEGNVVKDFKATSRTYDLDFLIKSRFKKFNPPKDVAKILENQGFELEHRYPDGFWKFDYFDKSIALYVEFLVPEIGRGVKRPVNFEQYKLKATALRHLEILSDYAITVNANGYDVLVPAPTAYVLQKMIINKERELEKQLKDQRAIDNILSYIHESFNLIEELKKCTNH